MGDHLQPPWDRKTVEALNEYQQAGVMQPFTCPKDRSNLTATENGWECNHCDYTQDWAHDFMILPETRTKPWWLS